MGTKHPRGSNGKLVSTTVLGRRFCNCCGKWKLLLYFPPRRHKNGKEYPNSPCEACHNRLNKKDRAWLEGDRRLRRQEYDRIWKEADRRKNGVKPRKFTTRFTPGMDDSHFCPSKKFHDFVTRYRHEELLPDQPKSVVFINGVRADSAEIRYLSHCRTGTLRFVSLDRADAWCTRFDLPLWELEEELRNEQ